MRSSILISAGFLILAGCSGGGGTAPAPPPPCGGTAIDTQAKLYFPASGATGVSPTVGSISYSYSNPALTNATVELIPSDGSTPVSSGLVVGNVVILPGIWSVLIPPLKPATSYHVVAGTVNMAHLPCYVAVTADLGTFSTQ